MSDTPSPEPDPESSRFTEAFGGINIVGPDGHPVKLTGGSLSVGCGCGQHWDGDDALAQMAAHECPLAGVELTAEDIFDMLDPTAAPRRAHMAEIAETIEQGHYNIQPVFPVDEDGVNFAYTIGLWPKYPGEILIRGFGDHCGRLVDFFAGHIQAGTFPLAEGEYVFDDTDPSAKIRIRPWDGDPTDFGIAMGHHGEDFPRWHLVLADEDGRFPGDPGCEVETYQMKGLPA